MCATRSTPSDLTGGQMLQRYLAQNEWSEADLAECILVSPERVRAYIEETERPPFMLALAMSRQLHVRGSSLTRALTATEWDDERDWVGRPGEFLERRRRDADLTAVELARLLEGPTKTNVWFWENGMHEPSPQNKLKLGQILWFDPNLLWPPTEEPKVNRTHQDAEFGGWLAEMRRQRNLTRAVIGQQIGLSTKQMSGVERGALKLTTEQVRPLAKMLKVPSDQVIERLFPSLIEEADLFWGPRFRLFWLRSGKALCEVETELGVSSATIRSWTLSRRRVTDRPPTNLVRALDYLARATAGDME